MIDKLKALVGKPINFFDRSGGPLTIEGLYISDWWNVQNTYLLKSIYRDKFFTLESLDGTEQWKYKVSDIGVIENNDIELK